MAGTFVNISVLGDKELSAALSKMPLKVQKKITRQALRTVAKHVMTDVKASRHILTGKLKASYKVNSIVRGKRGLFGVVVSSGTRGQLGISPDDRYYYPAVLEYGAPTRSIQEYRIVRGAADNNRSFLLAEAARVIRSAVQV